MHTDILSAEKGVSWEATKAVTPVTIIKSKTLQSESGAFQMFTLANVYKATQLCWRGCLISVCQIRANNINISRTFGSLNHTEKNADIHQKIPFLAKRESECTFGQMSGCKLQVKIKMHLNFANFFGRRVTSLSSCDHRYSSKSQALIRLKKK